MRLDKRVAFKIEEDITGRWLGQSCKPALVFKRQQFVERRSSDSGFKLNSRLLSNFCIAFKGRPCWTRAEGNGRHGKRR